MGLRPQVGQSTGTANGRSRELKPSWCQAEYQAECLWASPDRGTPGPRFREPSQQAGGPVTEHKCGPCERLHSRTALRTPPPGL